MKFLKFAFTFLGGILIGFGVGLIIGKNLVFSDMNFLLSSVASLVLGGFIMALGITIREKRKEPSKSPAASDKADQPGPGGSSGESKVPENSSQDKPL